MKGAIAVVLLAYSVIASAQKGIDPVLLAKAKRGDADAEYWLSLAYSQAGNEKESCRWGRISAENGNVDAQFVLELIRK